MRDQEVTVVDGADGLTPDMLRQRQPYGDGTRYIYHFPSSEPAIYEPGVNVMSTRSFLIYTVTRDEGGICIRVIKEGWKTDVEIPRRVVRTVRTYKETKNDNQEDPITQQVTGEENRAKGKP